VCIGELKVRIYRVRVYRGTKSTDIQSVSIGGTEGTDTLSACVSGELRYGYTGACISGN